MFIVGWNDIYMSFGLSTITDNVIDYFLAAKYYICDSVWVAVGRGEKAIRLMTPITLRVCNDCLMLVSIITVTKSRL